MCHEHTTGAGARYDYDHDSAPRDHSRAFHHDAAASGDDHVDRAADHHCHVHDYNDKHDHNDVHHDNVDDEHNDVDHHYYDDRGPADDCPAGRRGVRPDRGSSLRI